MIDAPSDGPLINDPRREAVDAMRGYSYQILRSVLAWIELSDDEFLYLEGAEDFDEISGEGATVTQVKDSASSGKVTLRTTGVVDAIANFWKHKDRNPDRRIRFRYLTTSPIGMEKGDPIGEGVPGLEIWHRLKNERSPDIQLARTGKIRDLLLTLDGLPENLIDFLRSATEEDIFGQLIEKISWDVGAGSSGTVYRVILDRLVTHGDRKGIATVEAEAVAASLYTTAWEVATRERGRMLSRADFIRIFDERTRITLPTSVVESLIQQAGLAASGGQPTLGPPDIDAIERAFGSTSAILLGWPQETEGEWIERPELNRLLDIAKGEEPTVTVLLGGPGEGKSALLARLGSELADDGVALLALKADRLPREAGSLEALDRWVGGPTSIVEGIRRIALDRRVVLLIDQLDALAELMDQHMQRLTAVIRLVDAVRGTPNVQVILACREFEFRNDIRLKTLDAEQLTLSCLSWEQVEPLLLAKGIDTIEWNQDARDVLLTPQHLSVFMAHWRDRRTPPSFTTYQGLLEWVIQERLAGPHGHGPIEAAEHIAATMAEEEELWLGKARFEKRYRKEVEILLATFFLIQTEDRLSLSFRHQTVFDFLRARAFLSDGRSIAEYVLREKQESLFVRPILWSALNFLRAADPAMYHREFRRLWQNANLRLHIRYLLIEFLGRLDDPDENEVFWLISVFGDDELRPKALRAIAGSEGWFDRLRGYLPSLMMESPQVAWETVLLIGAAVEFAQDDVLNFIEQYWLDKTDYVNHVFSVLSNVNEWNERAIDLAIRFLDDEDISAFQVRHIVERISKFRPDLAPRVVAARLNSQINRINSKQLTVPDPPAEKLSIDERMLLDLDRDDAIRRPFRKILESGTDWHDLHKIAVKAPSAFLDSVCPPVVAALERLADDPHPFRNQYRSNSGLSFEHVSPRPRDGGIPYAIEEAARAQAGSAPDEYLHFVAENQNSDLIVVHHILAVGMEVIAETRPTKILDCLLADPRRFAVGDMSDQHADSGRLIAAVVPALSDEEALILENAIMSWPPYFKSPEDENAETRFKRRKWTREHRLRLLRTFPCHRLSEAGRRHLAEEERALPDATDYDMRMTEFRSVGSAMTAEQMERATDDQILNLFGELPDVTAWDHPERRWDHRVGGSIQASREFAEFAKSSPERALAIMDKLTPLTQERPVAYALSALGENDDVNSEELILKVHEFTDKGFCSEEFRAEAARCLRSVAIRDKGLDDGTCQLLESWIEDWKRPPTETDDDEDVNERPRHQASEKDSEARYESVLWSGSHMELVPSGNYPILDAIMLGFLLREPGDPDSWLAALERHLERHENPRVWEFLGYHLHYLKNAQRENACAFFKVLLNRRPKLLHHKSGVQLVGHIHSLLSLEDLETILDRWIVGGWSLGPQVAGEISALVFCRQPDDAVAAERVQRFLDGASFTPAVASDLRLGIAKTLVESWREPEFRTLTTPLILKLIPIAEERLEKTLHSIFWKTDPLPLDEHTSAMLEGFLEHPRILVAGDPMALVDRLKDLLGKVWRPDLVQAIANALCDEAGREIGDLRTSWAGSATDLMEISLTLHRIGETRVQGLDLFEKLLAVDAYGVKNELVVLDRLPIRN